MYTFPFTRESVTADFVGKDLALYRNEISQSKYAPAGTLGFAEDGRITGHPEFKHWEVEDGILYLLDDHQKRVHRLDSLEVGNMAVYLTGEALREASSQLSRIILTERKKPEFRICISSHHKYYKRTLPRLLKSIYRLGLPEPLVVISDNSKRPEALCDIDGKTPMHINTKDKYGYTALLDTNSRVPYWLLLHDTCELTSDFSIDDIDVGLNPDIVLLGEGLDMGFYSSQFLVKARETVDGLRADKIRKQLMNQANVWHPASKPKTLRAKDVYGGGTSRSVLLMDIGIKKYIQTRFNGATP